MIKLNLNQKDYNLPSDWSEVTIAKFKKIYPFLSELNSDKVIRIISELSGIEYAELKNIDDRSLTDIFNELKFIFEEIPKIEFEDFKFEFQNQTYFLPETPQDICLGQWVDIEVIKDPIQNLNEIMTIITKISEDEKYDYNKLRKRIKIMDEMPITLAFSIFSHLEMLKKKYMIVLQSFSVVKELEGQALHLLTNWEKSGGGIVQLLVWPTTMFSKLKKWFKNLALKFSTFCHI